MSESAKPREPLRPAPEQGAGKAPSAPSRAEKRDEPVVWPRDLNAPSESPAWGSDPETVRDA
jgi:hypothetical protein